MVLLCLVYKVDAHTYIAICPMKNNESVRGQLGAEANIFKLV